MSGKDERPISIYPPECPQCGNSHEWFLGPRLWMLTEKSMKRRGYSYPIISFGIPSVQRINGKFIKCLGLDGGCRVRYSSGTEVYKAIKKAFRANLGKPYNSGLYGGVKDEWF